MSKIQKKSQAYHENIFLETFLQFLLCGKLFENYYPGYDILEFYNILVQIQFTTSKTKLDIQYSKLVTRVAERLKDLRKLENIRNIGQIAWCLVSLQEPRLSLQQLKNAQKQISNFSSPVQLLFHFVPNILSGILVCVQRVLL